MHSDRRFNLILSGLTLTNPSGAAIKVYDDVKVSTFLENASTLTDGAASTDKAAFDSEGQIVFYGNGTLSVSGNYRHGIFSNDYVRMIGGNIRISNAALDGIHGDYFQMYGGSLNVRNAKTGVDGDRGFIELLGGTADIAIAAADGKGMKCDSVITIGGTANITMSLTGDYAKGFKAGQSIVMDGGTVSITAAGATVVTNSDPAHCVGFKSSNSVVINGGDLTINATAAAAGGKCISADSTVTINGGTLHLTTSGSGGSYSNNGTTDYYSSACIKSDGNMDILAGNITCSSSGAAGKGISCGAALTIGIEGADNADLTLNVTTSGAQLGSSGGGGGWRPGPGSSSTQKSSPKGIKAVGDLIINSGVISSECQTTASEGGEAFESKQQVTINGGDIVAISMKDDGLNAGTRFLLNGGRMYVGVGQGGGDGLDANGTTAADGFIINGGTWIISSAGNSENAFDCEGNARLVINGGHVFGIGGSNMLKYPYTGSAQKTVAYTTSGNTAVGIFDSNNNLLFCMQVASPGTIIRPPGGGGSSIAFFSCPDFVPGTYTLKYGGSISGGTSYHGYYTGATYAGGTSKSFTISNNSYVTVQ